LFVEIACKSKNITFAVLDGYIKAEAKNRCTPIFKEDFEADITFIIRGFKIKKE
jgi:hypothetical protein